MKPWTCIAVAALVLVAVDDRVAVAQAAAPRSTVQPSAVADHSTRRTTTPEKEPFRPRSASELRPQPRADVIHLRGTPQTPERLPGRAGATRDARPQFLSSADTLYGVTSPWSWNDLSLVVGDIYSTPISSSAQLDQPYDRQLMGGLQLDVQPWRAAVYVDGMYAGLVQDFTGYYRHLELIAGLHQVAIVAPNYDPLFFEVVIAPGVTSTYRGTLTRAEGS